MKKMKNLSKVALFLFFASASLTSCTKDDDGPSTSGNIVGQWEFYKEGERVDGKEYLDLYQHSAGCNNDYVVFSNTNSFESTNYNADCSVDSSTGTYTKIGNTLTTTFAGESFSVEIKQLDKTTLKIYDTYTELGETFTDVTVLKRVAITAN